MGLRRVRARVELWRLQARVGWWRLPARVEWWRLQALVGQALVGQALTLTPTLNPTMTDWGGNGFRSGTRKGGMGHEIAVRVIPRVLESVVSTIHPKMTV